MGTLVLDLANCQIMTTDSTASFTCNYANSLQPVQVQFYGNGAPGTGGTAFITSLKVVGSKNKTGIELTDNFGVTAVYYSPSKNVDCESF